MANQFRAAAITALVVAAGLVNGAAPSDSGVEQHAKVLAGSLAAACPLAGYSDETAFRACAETLRHISLPLAPEIAWGGDQPDKPIRKKGLTHFNTEVFQNLYLPLFVFTGHWSLDEDATSHTKVIRLEAYFRNALPSGDFPYPFWHSSDKWKAYETANELRFYLDPDGRAFIVTRDAAGAGQHPGAHTHVTPPAFDGAWQWRDAAGNPQPHASLFTARYSEANPSLPALDRTYRVFALRLREESCLSCHTPSNKAGADRLVLLQTPLHAAGEIDNVIKAVKSQEMPQDDIGLRQDIPPADRTAILDAAIAFRDELARADRWEAAHRE